MQNDTTVYVGLDVHKESIVAAYAVGHGEAQSLGNIGVRDCDNDKLCTRMQSKVSKVVWVYEAGPCPSTQRKLQSRANTSAAARSPERTAPSI